MNLSKKSINLFLLLAFLFCLMLSACSTVTDPAEMYKGESSAGIFNKGEQAMRNHSYAEAIKRFEALEVQYPFGDHAEIAQLHLMYAYYMTSEYASAEASADQFIHAHPTSSHVDYAYLMRGLSNYYQNMGIFERLFSIDLATRDLTQIKKSYSDFAELVRIYPDSQYAPAAHQYLIYLRNVLANHELQVANYYYERAAYIAASNRASLIVRHYEGAPQVPNALVIMVKSYRKLHLVKNEAEALTVLQYNFPHSRFLKEALDVNS